MGAKARCNKQIRWYIHHIKHLKHVYKVTIRKIHHYKKRYYACRKDCYWSCKLSSTTGLTDSVTIREMKKKLKNKYFLSKSVNAERNQYIFFPPQKFYALEIKVTP